MDTIITDGLYTMLFGMAGIFIVMGILALSAALLNRLFKKSKDSGDD